MLSAALRVGVISGLGLLLAGCGTANFGAVNASRGEFAVTPGTATISTNSHLHMGLEMATGAGAGEVEWSLEGGDRGGAGTITRDGVYTPPAAIYGSASQVSVIARRKGAGRDGSDSGPVEARARLTITPGFLQPLNPENAAVTASGVVPLTAVVARVGGGRVQWSVAADANGKVKLGPAYGQISTGPIGGTRCDSGSDKYTLCTASYVAPAVLPHDGQRVYAVARIAGTENTVASQLLLSGDVNSSPATHQATQPAAVKLGSSGGNAYDYDTDLDGNILDCCGGTLGALLRGSDGQQYVLSTNHVLANSDQGQAGDAVVQPALIDSGCEPTHSNAVGTLRFSPALNEKATVSDAAVALVNDRENKTLQVDGSGAILELGKPDGHGTLSAAPPAAGTGEAVTTSHVPALLAKSGRSTGLTCAPVKAIAVTVDVPYYRDCAETRLYNVKRFENQLLIGAERPADAQTGAFSDITGDSGALVVDQANAQPVGLLYAANSAGTLANPVGDVLRDLQRESGGTRFQFAGGDEHTVACLQYGAGTRAVRTPTAEQSAEAAHAIAEGGVALAGEAMLTPATSEDAPGEAAIEVRLTGAKTNMKVPPTIAGVRTVVVRGGAAQGDAGLIAVPKQALDAALGAKSRNVQHWMKDDAVLGVGVAASLDDPAEAAVLVIVESGKAPAFAPSVVDGVRVRYEYADRFHTSHGRGYPEGRVASCSVK